MITFQGTPAALNEKIQKIRQGTLVFLFLWFSAKPDVLCVLVRSGRFLWISY